MFILGDQAHDRGKLPWVTFTLIGLNLLVFAAQIRFGDRMTNGLALVPKEVTEFKDLRGRHPIKINHPHFVGVDGDGEIIINHHPTTHYIRHYSGPFPIVLTFLTYMFLHGDIFHFLGNMWFLWIFARNVECALDHGRFIFFYLGCGVAAGLAQALSDMKSIVPIVGASGAIAGVMGAYLAIFPYNNIKIFLGGLIGFAVGIIQVPAFIVIGFWFVLQYLAGVMTMHEDMVGGTAYFCHIGGFVAGFVTIKAMVLYLQHQINLLKAEEGFGEPGPDGALPKTPPTIDQIDATLDPVGAFKRAREALYGQDASEDPFLRKVTPAPLKAELVEETDSEIKQSVTANLPSLPKPPRSRAAEPIHPFGSDALSDIITGPPKR